MVETGRDKTYGSLQNQQQITTISKKMIPKETSGIFCTLTEL